MKTHCNRRPLIAASTALGIGMGGFFDGIVFHQILQTHNMLSGWLPKNSIVNIEINMFWDGLFHAFCYLMVIAGLWMLWHAVACRGAPFSGKTYAGGMLMGWGIFNLVEGIVDHEILGVHHVLENGHHLPWDLAFLASGVVLLAIGWMMIRAARLPAGQADGPAL